MATSATFRVDIRRWRERALFELDTVIRRVNLEMLRRVIQRSPVGFPPNWQNPKSAPAGYVGGRFKNNWQCSVDSPAGGTIGEPDSSGEGALAAGQAVIDTMPLGGHSLWVVNNLPYAVRLEYGWSSQAAAGMVRITLLEFGGIVTEEIRSLP